MKIGYLGAGTWGFCLASLLASKGYETLSWTRDPELANLLSTGKDHPFLPGHPAYPNMRFTTNISDVLTESDIILEAVTSAGLRPVFEQIKSIKPPTCPIIIASKGIEQNTGLILPKVLIEVLGKKVSPQIAMLSGPGYAEEVVKGLPTSVVISAFNSDLMMKLCEIFTTPSFRVYPNTDILGVAYGGSLKNIIAIACGISEGLKLGNSAKAAIMTRGLHEIRKLAVAEGCKAETLNGLSGMGDLFLTCSSLISRNCRFGYLLAQGMTIKEAQKKIGTVVEGAYTCVSALQLSKQMDIPMPITEMVHRIIYQDFSIDKAVQLLMDRTIKEEHL